MKFRGIRMDNGALKEGNLVTRNCDGFSRTYIYDNSCDEVEIDEYCGDCDNETIKLKDLFIAVHPDSVSMETGQKDKNGVMIFGSIKIDGKMSRGGDIVTYTNEDMESPCDVKWKQENCGFETVEIDEGTLGDVLDTLEVIGKQYEEVDK